MTLADSQIRRLYDLGCSHWPEIPLPIEAFGAYLDGFGSDEDDGVLHAADLFLACACARGIAAALHAFETRYFRAVGGLVARINPSPEFADEVRQILRERLLVGPDAKIRGYRGIGSLESWVRMAALRSALNQLRDAKVRWSAERQLSDDFHPVLDAETRLLKETYGKEIEVALQRALESLSADRRLLLRLYYLEGLTLDKIAALKLVGRTTVFRWIDDARAFLREEVKHELHRRLQLSESNVQSLIRVATSNLELSLRALL